MKTEKMTFTIGPQSKILVWIMILVGLLVVCSTTVSAEWTKTYNPLTRTINVYNDGVLKAQLTLLYNTGQCGGDFTCRAVIQGTFYENGNGFFQQILFKDMKTGQDRSDIINEFRRNNTLYDGQDSIGTFTFALTGHKTNEDILDWRLRFRGVLLDDWAIWGQQTTYDDFSDTIVNNTLWNNGSQIRTCGTTGMNYNTSEDGSLMKVYAEVCNPYGVGTTSLAFAQSRIFPSLISVENISITTHAFIFTSLTDQAANLTVLGTTIVNYNANGNFDSLWEIRRNSSAGVNKFDYYENGVKSGQFTGTNNIIYPSAYCKSLSNGNACTAYINLEYVYYTINNKSMNITLQSPNQSQTIYDSSVINFNAYLNTTNSQFKNTSFFFDGVLTSTNVVTGQVNSSNFTINSNTINFGSHSWSIMACDSDNNCGVSDQQTFNNVPFTVDSISYNTSTFEGLTENFTLNITLNPSYTLLQSIFFHNNTQYSSVPVIDGTSYSFRNQVIIPPVSSQVNMTFFWSILLTNGTSVNQFNITFNNQTVNNIAIDDCTTNKVVIANFTQADEDSRNSLTAPSYNLTFDVDATVRNQDGSVVSNLSFNRTSKNNVAICISNLSTNTFIFDAEIKYSVITPDTYVTEYYNIQSFPLNTNNLVGNITLYPLLKTSSTEFLITLKDQDFNLIPNALIEIRRRYVFPSTPLTVEIPRTDAQGKTIAHFVLNDFKYDFLIYKDGVLLYTFQDMQPFCVDVATGNCQMELRILGDEARPSETSIPIDLTLDNYYNPVTRTINIPWSANDNQIHNLYLNVTNLMNSTEFCSGTVSSGFSGTLFCVIQPSVQNQTVIVSIQESTSTYFTTHLSLGGDTIPVSALTVIGVVILIGVLVFIAIPAGPSVTVIMFCVGLIVAVVTGMLGRNGIIGPASAVIWFFVAAGVLIWRLSKNERI